MSHNQRKQRKQRRNRRKQRNEHNDSKPQPFMPSVNHTLPAPEEVLQPQDGQVKPKKKWWKSKTLWFNVLAYSLYDFGHYMLPELATQMSPEHYLYMTLGVNSALRFATSKGIK